MCSAPSSGLWDPPHATPQNIFNHLTRPVLTDHVLSSTDEPGLTVFVVLQFLRKGYVASVKTNIIKRICRLCNSCTATLEVMAVSVTAFCMGQYVGSGSSPDDSHQLYRKQNPCYLSHTTVSIDRLCVAISPIMDPVLYSLALTLYVGNLGSCHFHQGPLWNNFY